MQSNLLVLKNIHSKIQTLLRYDETKTQTNKGRKLSMPISMFITLGVLKQLQGIETKKSVYQLFELKTHCSYKTLVVNLNRFAKEAVRLLSIILHYNSKNSHWIKHTDSTDIPVSLLKNMKKHKIWAGIAKLGHSGKGWYYGLKLHLTSDYQRKILSFKLTPADSNDRKVFQDINKDLFGYFIADAGYISNQLEKDFVLEGKRYILIRPQKRMKKIATELQILLYRTRMRIEHIFQNLKVSYRLVTSLPRSISGYLANYLYSILSYLIA